MEVDLRTHFEKPSSYAWNFLSFPYMEEHKVLGRHRMKLWENAWRKRGGCIKCIFCNWNVFLTNEKTFLAGESLAFPHFFAIGFRIVAIENVTQLTTPWKVPFSMNFSFCHAIAHLSQWSQCDSLYQLIPGHPDALTRVDFVPGPRFGLQVYKVQILEKQCAQICDTVLASAQAIGGRRFRINLDPVKWVSHVRFHFQAILGLFFCKLRLFWEGFQGVAHQQGSHGHNATVCFWAPWGHGSSVLWMPGRQDGRDCGRRMSAGTFVSWAQRPLPRALHAEATVPSPLCLGARWEVAEFGFFAALCLLLSTVLFSVVTTWPHTTPEADRAGVGGRSSPQPCTCRCSCRKWKQHRHAPSHAPQKRQPQKIPSQNATETPTQPTALLRHGSWAPGAVGGHRPAHLMCLLARTGAGRLKHWPPVHSLPVCPPCLTLVASLWSGRQGIVITFPHRKDYTAHVSGWVVSPYPQIHMLKF